MYWKMRESSENERSEKKVERVPFACSVSSSDCEQRAGGTAD